MWSRDVLEYPAGDSGGSGFAHAPAVARRAQGIHGMCLVCESYDCAAKSAAEGASRLIVDVEL